ncbi:MAG: TIGR04086 family membrane protein [Bacillota bacterium]|jgi:putative membrane protein (TIGR04086 family)
MSVRSPSRRSALRPVTPPASVGFSFRALLSGLVFSIIFSFVLFLIWSLVFTVTDLPDRQMLYAAYLTSFLAVLLGGRRATMAAGGAGLIHGGLVGLLYGLLLLGASMLISSIPVTLGATSWGKVAANAVIGVIGGIWGAGSRRR